MFFVLRVVSRPAMRCGVRVVVMGCVVISALSDYTGNSREIYPLLSVPCRRLIICSSDMKLLLMMFPDNYLVTSIESFNLVYVVPIYSCLLFICGLYRRIIIP